MTDLSRTPANYSATARHIHWLMAFLIIATFVLALVIDDLPKSWKANSISLHKATGLAILLLLAFRILWRFMHRPPSLVELNPKLRRLAGLGHFTLYALMLAVSVFGLIYAALRGLGLEFGLFSISPIFEANRAAARPYRQLHELSAYALLGLAGLHAITALWHHYIRKDGVLQKMLPKLQKRARSS